MAKAPTTSTPAREPVTARGLELLMAINDAPDGVLMLTQDEGAEAVAAGHAAVDTSKVEGNTAAVSLTDAGRAEITAANEPNKAAAVAASNGFAIDDDVPMPGNSAVRRGRSGGYPFEALEVGKSFHVSKPDDATVEELLTRLSSSVSGARARFAEETGETESVKVKTYQKDANGKFVKDEAGKRVVASETNETRPKMRTVRDFKAAIVDSNDPRGVGVRIWRTA